MMIMPSMETDDLFWIFLGLKLPAILLSLGQGVPHLSCSEYDRDSHTGMA